MQELIERLHGAVDAKVGGTAMINADDLLKTADMLESQAAEIAELDALRNDAVLRLDTYKALVAEARDKSGSCIICGFHPEMAAMWCDDYLKLKSLLENKHE